MSIKKKILWWVIIISVIVVVSHFSKNTTKEYSPQIYHTKGDFFVSISKEDFKKAQDYKIAKDLKALKELLTTGKIFYLKPGIEVYRLNSTFGLVKIRAKGTTIELWTYREEIY